MNSATTAAMFFSAFLLPACTVASGPWGKYSALGGNAKGITKDGIAEVNNSLAFGKVTETVRGMWTNYLMAEGIKYLADKYYGVQGAEISAAETVKLEELKNAKSHPCRRSGGGSPTINYDRPP